MKLNIEFGELERLRESIGANKASLGEISAKRSYERDPIEKKLIETGSVILTPEELAEVLHFPGGLAAIGNTQITLHIYQPLGRNASREDLEKVPAPAPRYHVADCDTLEKMRDRGRFNRYVSTSNADGYFRVEPLNWETKKREDEILASLAPCQNCLKSLNYDGFEDKSTQERRGAVDSFDIQKFFHNYEPIFRCLPLYTADNFPEGNYTADWARISEEVRRGSGWICSECEVDLKDNRRLLHVHHKDGNRGNNRLSNLKPLCCLCHQKQPFHENMHIDPSEKRLIAKLVS